LGLVFDFLGFWVRVGLKLIFWGLGLVFAFFWLLVLGLGLVFGFFGLLGLGLSLVFVFFWVWVKVEIQNQTQNPSFF